MNQRLPPCTASSTVVERLECETTAFFLGLSDDGVKDLQHYFATRGSGSGSILFGEQISGRISSSLYVLPVVAGVARAGEVGLGRVQVTLDVWATLAFA